MKIFKLNDFIIEAQVGKHEIKDINIYLENMSAGLSDKLYFLNEVHLDVLIDFGCADGILLNYISEVNKNIKLIGYDIDDRMINIARNKYPNIQFEKDWNIIERFIEQNNNLKIGILLSSVIHEVYSYSKLSTISHFWKKQVFNNNIDYVIIRDMMSSNNYPKVNDEDIEKIRLNANQKQLIQFEDEWGNIDKDYRIFLHWLLKYRYLINWGRELYENYLPITIEHLKNKWIPSSWSIIFEDYYTLPFLKKIIKQDFDIDINQPTHLKMIIKNNKQLNENKSDNILIGDYIITNKLYNNLFDEDYGASEEDLNNYLNILDDYYKNGGKIQRIIFSYKKPKITDSDHSWTHINNDVENFIQSIYDFNIENENIEGGEGVWLIIGETEPKNILINASLEQYQTSPEEEELTIDNPMKIKILSIEKLNIKTH